MEVLSVLLLAVGLASDAFAASITSGIAAKRIRFRDALKTGAFFGGFQGMMPVIGWCCGNSIQGAIEAYDHWIAFFLLGFVGIKTMAEAFLPKNERTPRDFRSTKELLVLAIATSIDAMAVGISLAMTDANILYNAAVIAVATFLLCVFGVMVGKKLGPVFERKAGILGGTILVLMGIRILTEHLMGLE